MWLQRLLISFSIALLFFSCQRHARETAKEVIYSKEDLLVDVFVQKEVGGSPEDSSHLYLHLIVKDTLPESVDLRSFTFMWQGFTLNPFQTIYKFKLKPPEQGLHQKGTLHYVNKSKEVTVIRTKQIIVPVPQKEALYLP